MVSAPPIIMGGPNGPIILGGMAVHLVRGGGGGGTRPYGVTSMFCHINSV